MDSLANQLSNVSLYDVKKYVRKAQNAVLNFSEMEAKVREATNNEPWGTPTSTMQQIADATNNYRQFHEIMPFIYRRFTEKTAAEWRQIYKSLQLLDYLVRNGSERVVDYARSHVSVVETLKHFGYIDSRGVDQGASIRKRAEELVGLLSDTEKLRAERKKSKQLHAKTLNGSFGSGGFGGSGRKYGGISSETYRQQLNYGGASTQQFYGDGGGFDGSNNIIPTSTNGFSDDEEFEEYEVTTEMSSGLDAHTDSRSGASSKAKAEDDEDDEFSDFQTAPIVSEAPKQTNASILDLFDSPAPSAPSAGSSLPSQPIASSSAIPGVFNQPASSKNTLSTSTAPSKPAANLDIFDSLWESGKTTIGSKSSAAAKPLATSTSLKPDVASSSNIPSLNAQPSKPANASSSSEPVDLLSF